MSTPDADQFMQNYRELCGYRESIFWLFHGRCIVCKEAATDVNEIIPRARTVQAVEDYHNQVTLCHSCHMEFHANGVTKAKQKVLVTKRKEFLRSIGREQYI